MNGFAPRLVLIQRQKATQQRPIIPHEALRELHRVHIYSQAYEGKHKVIACTFPRDRGDVLCV